MEREATDSVSREGFGLPGRAMAPSLCGPGSFLLGTGWAMSSAKETMGPASVRSTQGQSCWAMQAGVGPCKEAQKSLAEVHQAGPKQGWEHRRQARGPAAVRLAARPFNPHHRTPLHATASRWAAPDVSYVWARRCLHFCVFLHIPYCAALSCRSHPFL